MVGGDDEGEPAVEVKRLRLPGVWQHDGGHGVSVVVGEDEGRQDDGKKKQPRVKVITGDGRQHFVELEATGAPTPQDPQAAPRARRRLSFAQPVEVESAPAPAPTRGCTCSCPCCVAHRGGAAVAPKVEQTQPRKANAKGDDGQAKKTVKDKRLASI